MIFGADVGVPLTPPSFASISQSLEKCSYFLAHAREDIPSGIGARGLGALDQSNTNFLELRKAEVQLRRKPLPGSRVNRRATLAHKHRSGHNAKRSQTTVLYDE